MAYSSGFLKDLCTIINRKEATTGKFGRNSGGVQYEDGSTIHCNLSWVKGVKTMKEGALDAYDYVMLRCRWTAELKRESRFKVDGKTYQIQSFHADKQANEIQITAVELSAP